MVTKVVAGACLLGLAAMTAPSEARSPRGAGHPIVVRISVPLPAGEHHGYASFSASLSETRWRIAARCTGGREHGRLALVLAAEPVRAD